MKRGARGARVLFFFFLLLILLAMFFWSGLKISGNAVASLNNSSTVDYNLGDSVRINLSVNNVTNLSGIQVNVSYNPSVLTYTGAEEGSFLNENGDTLSAPAAVRTGWSRILMFESLRKKTSSE